MFWKNLQAELTAKKMWEFTDVIKNNIWKDLGWDDEIRKEYKNGNIKEKYGWQLESKPIFEAYEKIQREHTFDYLSTSYIQLRFAYNFWKQYETEWNKKYKDCE